MAEITRGEIWLADLNPVRGHEQAGKRPCLVISADLFNQGASGLVVVLPVTSKDKGIPFHLKMVRSQKSIGGAVGSRLGNAPYKLGVLLRSAFGIALCSAFGIALFQSPCKTISGLEHLWYSELPSH